MVGVVSTITYKLDKIIDDLHKTQGFNFVEISQLAVNYYDDSLK